MEASRWSRQWADIILILEECWDWQQKLSWQHEQVHIDWFTFHRCEARRGDGVARGREKKKLYSHSSGISPVYTCSLHIVSYYITFLTRAYTMHGFEWYLTFSHQWTFLQATNQQPNPSLSGVSTAHAVFNHHRNQICPGALIWCPGVWPILRNPMGYSVWRVCVCLQPAIALMSFYFCTVASHWSIPVPRQANTRNWKW